MMILLLGVVACASRAWLGVYRRPVPRPAPAAAPGQPAAQAAVAQEETRASRSRRAAPLDLVLTRASDFAQVSETPRDSAGGGSGREGPAEGGGGSGGGGPLAPPSPRRSPRGEGGGYIAPPSPRGDLYRAGGAGDFSANRARELRSAGYVPGQTPVVTGRPQMQGLEQGRGVQLQPATPSPIRSGPKAPGGLFSCIARRKSGARRPARNTSTG